MGIKALGVNAVGYTTPSPIKQTVASNYLDFTSGANDWAQQYLPELVEQEAEVFGNRSVSGFLEKVGAEEAAASDQVVWSEQGRLHIDASGTIVASTGVVTSNGHGVRKGDTVLLNQSGVGSLRCYVTDSTANTYTVKPYSQAAMDTAGGLVFNSSNPVVGFVFGSEYKKGDSGRDKALQPEFQSRSNQMIILKDLYEVSGSDAAQIGWVEVSGEDGQSGYLWYLKAAGDTKTRFADYCEMSLIESETKDATSTIDATIKGSEGLWQAIDNRGIVAEAETGGDFTLDTFDAILKEFDKQGSIEEYMMFLNRSVALNVDDMLAAQNQLGGSGSSSFGVFDNDADMALNLGFSGFRRGSYDFYKTDWKYLNDATTRGQIVGDAGDVYDVKKGVMVPAGVSTVYDQALGKNLKRPFLHVRYRSAGMEDRRFKTWTTGSVGAATDSIDAMEMHFLTERCLIVQGANNFCTLVG